MPEPQSESMSLLAHLEELRTRLLRMASAVGVFLIPGWFLAEPLIAWIHQLGGPPDTALYYTAPLMFFLVRIKVGLMCALILATPILADQIWRFVLPALRPKEIRLSGRLAAASGLLFLAGAVLALTVVFPALMRFAYGMATDTLRPLMHVDAVVDLALTLALGFGLTFQIPVILFFCVNLGLVRIETVRRLRPYWVLGFFVLAALLTPPDIISQLAMAVPAWLLFETSLFILRRPTTTAPPPDD